MLKIVKDVDYQDFVKKPPKLSGRAPIWFHNHGWKMELKGSSKKEILIKGSAAKLIISVNEEREDSYLVIYEINHGVGETKGSIRFNMAMLLDAFGMTEHFKNTSILSDYGGDSAMQGAFIRWKDFLNIPGPGTAFDGDPNISLEINEDMRVAVRDMLLKRGK